MLSLIVPAFNEADNLRRYPGELFPVLAGLDVPSEVIVVDDGSTDATPTVAASLGAPVRVVAHPRNLGLGAAVRTGIAEARGDLLVTIDADLTFAPTLIPKLLERFRKGDVDVVAGSPKLAGYASDVPRYRIIVSHASTLVYSSLLGMKVTAVTPILRLYRVADLRELTLESVGFDINAEILFGLIRKGRRVAEIPAPLTQRLHGESHLDYPREVRRHLRLVRKMVSWRLGLSGRSASI